MISEYTRSEPTPTPSGEYCWFRTRGRGTDVGGGHREETERDGGDAPKRILDDGEGGMEDARG